MKLVEDGWNQLGQTAIRVQVLQEFFVNLLRQGISRHEAVQFVTDYMNWPVVDNSLDLLRAALQEQIRWQLSLWDALILAAARTSGATKLYSEDFNHGQDYDGLRAINPFL